MMSWWLRSWGVIMAIGLVLVGVAVVMNRCN
jgi:hypothetical protein